MKVYLQKTNEMEKDSFWFSHDSNASEDEKCILLIDQMGLEGYGIFWVLVEKLRNQADYKLKFKVVPGIAKRYGTSTEKMMTVITKFDLFQYNEDDFFYSESLNRRMENWEMSKSRRHEIAVKASQTRWNKVNNAYALPEHCQSIAEVMQSDAITEQDRIEENKIEQKKKRKYSKSFSSENDAPPLDFEKLKDYWNKKAQACGLPEIMTITDKRKKTIIDRYKENGKDAIIEVMNKVTKSKFLTGSADKEFKASFDWIFKNENFLKILEGNYDNPVRKRFNLANFGD